MPAIKFEEKEFAVVVDGQKRTVKHKITVTEKPISFGGFTSGQRIEQPVAGRLDCLRSLKGGERVWVVQLDSGDFKMRYLTPAALKAKPVAKVPAAPVTKVAAKLAKVGQDETPSGTDGRTPTRKAKPAATAVAPELIPA